MKIRLDFSQSHRRDIGAPSAFSTQTLCHLTSYNSALRTSWPLQISASSSTAAGTSCMWPGVITNVPGKLSSSAKHGFLWDDCPLRPKQRSGWVFQKSQPNDGRAPTSRRPSAHRRHILFMVQHDRWNGISSCGICLQLGKVKGKKLREWTAAFGAADRLSKRLQC